MNQVDVLTCNPGMRACKGLQLHSLFTSCAGGVLLETMWSLQHFAARTVLEIAEAGTGTDEACAQRWS